MNEKPGAGGLMGHAFFRLERYSRHDSAWIEWNPKIQADRCETSGFVYDRWATL